MINLFLSLCGRMKTMKRPGRHFAAFFTALLFLAPLSLALADEDGTAWRGPVQKLSDYREALRQKNEQKEQESLAQPKTEQAGLEQPAAAEVQPEAASSAPAAAQSAPEAAQPAAEQLEAGKTEAASPESAQPEAEPSVQAAEPQAAEQGSEQKGAEQQEAAQQVPDASRQEAAAPAEAALETPAGTSAQTPSEAVEGSAKEPGETSAQGQVQEPAAVGNEAQNAVQEENQDAKPEVKQEEKKAAELKDGAEKNSTAKPIVLKAAPQAAPAQDAHKGGRIVFGTIGEPSNLNPYISMDSASHEVADYIFISPLRYDKNLCIEPWAAESVELSADGRTLTIRLKKGILWEDGVELTADDLVYTVKTVAKPETGSPYAEDFMRIKSIEADDKYTVTCTYEKYYARALPSFCSAILPKHLLEGQDWRSGEFARKPIGAGPFKLAGWESGSMVTLTANERYFMGRPNLDEVIYRVIPDSATMFMELRAKRLDMMGLSPEQYLLQTKDRIWQEDFTKYRYLSSAYTYLGFNMRHPFFQDKRVRKAISYAINRDELVQGALLGQGVAAFGPYKPGTSFYHPTLKPIAENREKALALLHEAGFEDADGDGILEKDGHPLAFIVLTNQGNNERILAATIIQRQLRKVGIDIQVRTVEWAAFINEFVNKGSFDAVILGWTITPDPDLYQVWHSSQAVAGGLNFTGFTSKELDELLEEGRITQDEARRKEIYNRVQEILHEEQPYCFLYVPYALPVLNAKFKGIEPALAGITWNMERWWVKDEEKQEAPAISPK